MAVYSNSSLYYANMVTTFLFAIMHPLFVGVFFNGYSQADWLLIAWSGIQYFLIIYSLLLIFGSIPIQIVMLYMRLIIRIIIFMFMATSLVMIMTPFAAIIMEINTDNLALMKNAFFYELCIHGPTLMFLFPLLLFLNDVDSYIAKKYPSLYNNDNLFMMALDNF